MAFQQQTVICNIETFNVIHLPMILHDVKVLMVACVIVRPPAEMIVPGAPTRSCNRTKFRHRNCDLGKRSIKQELTFSMLQDISPTKH
jgi:hypothetical protein